MLPTELLMFRVKGGVIEPKRLKGTTNNLKLAETLIQTFEQNVGRRRFELNEDLMTLEAGRTDFKVLRGLARLLTQRCEFEAEGDVPPSQVRERIFALAQGQPPSRRRTRELLAQVSESLHPGRSLAVEEVAASLYADLEDQQTLTTFDPLTPEELIHRFDLAQAQGVLYRAYSLTITARRNEPARYK